jgi:aspartyl/glutamyl-tRNA(Asn/Gln) amidotransferase C subunit
VPDEIVSEFMSEFTPEIFDHLVELAELELSEDEAEYLRRELNTQLSAVRELEAIQLTPDIAITTHGVPYTEETRPPLREDVIEPCEEANEILEGAAQVFERYIVVPDIPTEELE